MYMPCCVCVRACVCACVHACVHACVCACVCERGERLVLSLCLFQLINLTNEGGTLRPDIKRGVDYEFIPEQVWRSLTFWYRSKYGRDGPALPRYVSERWGDEMHTDWEGGGSG